MGDCTVAIRPVDCIISCTAPCAGESAFYWPVSVVWRTVGVQLSPGGRGRPAVCFAVDIQAVYLVVGRRRGKYCSMIDELLMQSFLLLSSVLQQYGYYVLSLRGVCECSENVLNSPI